MKKFYKLHSKSLAKHKVANYKELWEKLQSKGYKGLEVQVKTTFVKSKSEDNRFHATFSTDSTDRHGEVVVQNWVLANFKANPVYLDSHNYGSIEHIIGKVENIKISKENKLVGDIIFATSNPKGQLAMDLARDGFLNASSVGFIPLEFSKDWETILKSELLEISAVSVPANADATYDKKCVDCDLKEPEEVKEVPPEETKEEVKEPETTTEETVIEEPVIEKSSPAKIVNLAVKQVYDIKSRALGRILSAIELVSLETKGRQFSNEEKTNVNAKINRAIKTLLDLKK